MSIDTIGNFLTNIRNSIMASKPAMVTQYSKMRNNIASILKQEGFIKGFELLDQDGKKYIKLHLKFVDGESVIHEIKRVSKPSRRIYQGFDELDVVVGKLGVSILTTDKGIMTDKQARDMKVGGEVICSVW